MILAEHYLLDELNSMSINNVPIIYLHTLTGIVGLVLSLNLAP